MSYVHKIGSLIIIVIGSVSLLTAALLVVDIVRLLDIVHPNPTWKDYLEPLNRLLWSFVLTVIATILSIASGVWIVRGFYLNNSLRKAIDRLSIAFYFPHFIVAVYVLALAQAC
ncbi:hypothetical protein [Paenisporosarcina sp. TG20]|uniref:hypothetical protein n=1 Tax=Paenisporosarcina sp. TG20 TaxID=1211706 RepID=UPI0002FD8146|nr:hypothetical protein [Paenisporosarcina sp. TG20]